MLVAMAVFVFLLAFIFVFSALWSESFVAPTPKSAYQLEIEAVMRKQDTMREMRDYAKAQRK
ncbi:hypothetical protein QN355_19495 [Cryobacterium sp. 10S3]|uniref:hypothetical protein n=1 Tax=Cryobacterium sp. 10S3 TaxID=3048582 RepID=UPI002AC98AED|nr:hypothetical protein [Cryobacterium sp. 10S3]MEB0288715.1 hypothetical protein [Cryobacterium sp. 10S3]WPX14211.1 hypothetical protein RHM57_02210 [Cryobacterium sp. 10S3]